VVYLSTKFTAMGRVYMFRVLVCVWFVSVLGINSVFAGIVSGTGTQASPYEITIATFEEFSDLVENKINKPNVYCNIKLVADIDGSKAANAPYYGGYGYLSSIGRHDSPFKGSFNGNGYVISNVVFIAGLSSDLKYYPLTGCFGYTKDAIISNVKLSNCKTWGGDGEEFRFPNGKNTTKQYYGVSTTRDDTGNPAYTSGDKVGGLIGYAVNTTVNNCYFSGVVATEGYDVGGLIGRAENTSITGSYASAVVLGNNNIGGLVGYLDGTSSIQNCYSTSAVEAVKISHNGNTAGNHVGGFVGYALDASKIDNAYATGYNIGYNGAVVTNQNVFMGGVAAGSPTDTYFDTDLSGVTSNSFAKELSYLQFKDANNFTSLGSPWVKPATPGSDRPYINWQEMMVANNAVKDNVLSVSIHRNAGKTVSIKEAGVRVRKTGVEVFDAEGKIVDSDKLPWIYQAKSGVVLDANGNVNYTLRVKGLEDGESYYFQSYIKDSKNEYHLGDLHIATFLPEHQITYAKNDSRATGTTTDNNLYRHNIDEVTVKSNNFSFSYYDFKGWDTQSSGTGTRYQAGHKFTLSSDLTVYAIWSPTEYTITYNMQGGGDKGTNPDTYNVETAKANLVDGSRPGYNFMGWYGDNTFTTAKTSIGGGETGNKTIYAKWSAPINYTLTYEANNGVDTKNLANLPTNVNFTVETETFSLGTSTRNGYSFGGWYADAYGIDALPVGAQPIIEIKKGTTENLTVHAYWWIDRSPGSDNEYILSFDANDNSGVPTAAINVPKDYVHYVDSENYTLPIPSRPGFTFGGWYTEKYAVNATPDASKQVISLEKGVPFTITVYALWKTTDVDSFYLAFNANDNSGDPSKATVPANEKLNVLDTPFDFSGAIYDATRPGYTFDGWYASADGTGSELNVVPLGTVSDFNVYAKWKIDPLTNHYDLIFNANDDDNPVKATGVPANFNFDVETADITLAMPERKGYTFGGWFETAYAADSNPTEPAVTVISRGTVRSYELHAYWEVNVNAYTLTYHANDDALNPINKLPQQVMFSVTDEIILETVTRSGYEFVEWQLADGTPLSKVPVGTAQNIDVYAQWLVPVGDPFKINFNLNDSPEYPADAMSYNPKTFYVNSEDFNLEIPVRNGYTFDGWYEVLADGSEGAELVTVTKGTARDYDVIAHWLIQEANKFNLIFDKNHDIAAVPEAVVPELVELDASKTPFDFSATTYNGIRNGYTFSGWFKDPACTDGPVTQVPAGAYEDYRVYAKWEITVSDNYELRYNANDDLLNPVDASLFPANVPFNVETETFTLPDAVRTGYTFSGWYRDVAYGVDEVADPNKRITQIVQGTEFSDVEVYAHWTVHPEDNKYTLVYERNDEGDEANPATVPSPVDYYVNTETFTLGIPSRDGYSFGGWYKKPYDLHSTPNPADKVVSIEKGTTEDVTVYAYWYLGGNYYLLTYHANDDALNPVDVLPVPVTFNVTSETIELQPAVRPGYTFSGWYTVGYGVNSAPGENGKLSDIAQGTVGNIDVYAYWTIGDEDKYKLVYEENDGGDKVNPATVPSDGVYYVNTKTFALGNAIRRGYTFNGWYTNPYSLKETPLSSTKVERIETGTTQNTTVYAHWIVTDADKYSITYLNTFGNNGGNPSSYDVTSETINLLKPSRLGYTFSNWFSEAEEINVVTQIEKGSVGNKTLYAGWYIHPEDNVYTITYETDGGENNVLNPLSYNIETESFIFLDASKKHYKFEGWYSDEAFTIEKTGVDLGSTGHVTVYAKWTPVDYSIKYHLNGGENSAINPDGYHIESPIITFGQPTKPGYVFEGWYSTEDLLGDPIVSINTGSSGDINLYAKWKIEIDIICKWGYVLIVSDSENELQPYFQWYKDDVAIDGANLVSFEGFDKSLCGDYTCEVMLKGSTEKFKLKPYKASFNCIKTMISIYPTVTEKESQIKVELTGDERASSVFIMELFDVTGQKIISKTVENNMTHEIASPVKSGVYIITLRDTGGIVETEKIIVR